jgi:hypothetical protein
MPTEHFCLRAKVPGGRCALQLASLLGPSPYRAWSVAVATLRRIAHAHNIAAGIEAVCGASKV